MNDAPRIVVVGLGYVGLPLAIALARKFDVIGFDIDRSRIAELREGRDRTREIDADEIKETRLRPSDEPEACAGADVFIVTVPTPVDAANRPDLSAVLAATRMVAGLIDAARRPTIVYESTVYPGVTEETCGAALAGKRVSACRKINASPAAARAPAFICSPRPRALATTRSHRAAASSRVPSLLPPSATMTSCPPARSGASASRVPRIRIASPRVGTMTEIFISSRR